jgi:hypothetical protein
LKRITSIWILTFLLTSATGLMSGQSIDLSGTWVGETVIPDAIDPDEITLVLAIENGEYSGKVSDSMGMFDDTECEDIEFMDNKLTFNIEANSDDGYMRIYVTLIVEGDTLSGHWENEDGSTGKATMRKKKS